MNIIPLHLYLLIAIVSSPAIFSPAPPVSNGQEPDTLAASYPMGEFMGTNSFIDVPSDRLQPVGWIREYHPWSFNEIENDVFEYNRWNGFWDFDRFYAELDGLNIMACPVLWSSPSWLQPAGNDRPVVGDEDPLLPWSYREISEFVFQFAARYGYAEVPDSMLLVNSGQVKKSGLGLIRYYEDWNEQDKDWEGPQAEFSPAQYAAMASANIDGHQGSLGPGHGIRQADSSAQFVMGGLAGLDTSYLGGMREWFARHRSDTDWPIDVINVHHYSFVPGETGISPESDQLQSKISAVTRWRDLHAPGCEVWVSEFGYDTNPESMNRAPVIGSLGREEVQAAWNMRTYMLLAAAGVDRAAQFMIRDSDPGGDTYRYADCGMVTSMEEGHVKKLSWYYQHTMYTLLKEFHFSELKEEENGILVARFIHPDLPQAVYACWDPGAGDQTSEYLCSIYESCDSVTITRLDTLYKEGISNRAPVEKGKVQTGIGQIPVFISVTEDLSASQQQTVLQQREVTVFPNPAEEQLNISIRNRLDMQEMINLQIVDAHGSRIRSRTIQTGPGLNLISVDTHRLKPGIYMLRLCGATSLYRTVSFVIAN